uniref:G-protein coupled receptors family 1 profile domain-containing protein n=3 Tax=Parascaris univalens TaxID=6257 RepID=A0A915B6A0_PARUN
MHDGTEGLPIVSDDFSVSSNYSTAASPPYLAYFTQPHTSVSIPQSSLIPVDGLRSNAAAYVDEEELPEWCNVLSLECECHISYQFYDYEEVLLLGLVTLPIIIFGLCANLTSIRIFTHRLMISSSINWYLGVLSCSDTFILFSAFFVLSLPRIGEYTGIWIATSCSYWVAPYMYGLMTLSQTISVWMTTGMSVHRYIGVCLPFKAASLLEQNRVRIFILSLLAFSVLFNTTRFFEVRVVNNCFRSNINEFIPVLNPSDLRLNATYRLIFFGWAYTILMFVVPFSILIVLNSQVLFAVRRSNRLHHRGAQDEAAKRAERKERQTSIMLVAIVLVFLSCNTLAFVVNILENVGYDNELYVSLVTYNNFLVIVNASCNIAIYMLFSDKYRLLLRHYLLCDWSREGEMLLSTTYA